MRMIRFVALLAGTLVLVPSVAQAQDRATLLQQARDANDDFDAPRGIRIARSALDPALGPLDQTWATTVHLLAQMLIEEGQRDQAELWARWAMRQYREMPIDSVAFLSAVSEILRRARTEVTPEAGDAFSGSAYQWPSATSTSNEARFRVAASATPVTVLVTGVGLVVPQGLVVPPGSYDLEVSANGFLPLHIRREALPGVVTEFSFTLVPATAAAATLADAARSRLFASTVPLNITRFGMTQACVAGVTADGGRLVVTSYQAIRGADAVDAAGAVRVAAWDVTANLAVLMLPAVRPDTLDGDMATLVDGQALWGVDLADCRTPTEVRTVVESWENRPQGALVFESQPALVIGSPLVNYEGRFAGTWSGGLRAAPATVIQPLLARARENIIAQNTRTPQEVATQENHRYGSVVIAADVPGATVRLTPLEAWQWEELAASGPAPFTFRGASGRYRMEVTAPDFPAKTQEVVLRGGESTRTAVQLRTVVAAAAQPEKRGMPKWVWAVAIGGGAAAAVALGGGGGGGASGGSISISVPANP